MNTSAPAPKATRAPKISSAVTQKGWRLEERGTIEAAAEDAPACAVNRPLKLEALAPVVPDAEDASPAVGPSGSEPRS